MPAPDVVFVLGSGRSGTTVALSAIGCIDGVVTVPRLAGRVPQAILLATWMARHRLGPQGLIRPSAECSALFDESGLSHSFHARVGRPITPSDVPDPSLSKLHRRLNTVRRAHGVETVAVKSTLTCARVPLLAAAFPDAVFVHIIRHPAEVVHSLLAADFWPGLTLWWDGRTTEEYGHEMGLSQAEVAAEHWSRQVASAIRDLSKLEPTRVATINYRDLVHDPLSTLEMLSTVRIFLGDPISLSRRLERLNIRHQGSHLVSKQVQQAVNSRCNRLAAQLGLAT